MLASKKNRELLKQIPLALEGYPVQIDESGEFQRLDSALTVASELFWITPSIRIIERDQERHVASMISVSTRSQC